MSYQEAVRLLNSFLAATPKLLQIVAKHNPDHAETFSSAIQLLPFNQRSVSDIQGLVGYGHVKSEPAVVNDHDDLPHREPVPRMVFDFCALLFLTLRKVHTTKKQIWTAMITAGLDVGEYATCAQRLATNLKEQKYIYWPPKGHNGAVTMTESGKKYLAELTAPGERGLGEELVAYYKEVIEEHVQALAKAPIQRARPVR
ncbi:hypothetical protein OVA03_07890 [Asticcacaulis sp. SL142]|uniref:hypothetical protein n=1 Tax=Asticcacaulis sp. SL142 TaxID=2995155 RepID=UPI00226C80F2|nr:hypothetical protein [Asticcacaulis sp. SL142]WAC49807.1 hypothetical protein OVA03_07890 [Asticcacaulis sp. SL142]